MFLVTKKVKIVASIIDFMNYAFTVPNTGGYMASALIPDSVLILSTDEALTAAANKARLVMPFSGTITSVTAALLSAPTGASVILDVNLGGTTIFTTQANRPTVAAGATTATTGTPNVVAFDASDILTVDCDQIGSSTAGTGFTVAVAYTGRSNTTPLDTNE